MPLLPPTVGERLARCGTRVWVFGVMPGSDVDLRRMKPDEETTVETITAEGSSALFELGSSLEANEKISARQRTASDESEWSNSVEVEDVMLPPAPPRTEPTIQRCGRCTLADGAPPGSMVELIQDGDVIGKGEINRFGAVCLRIDEMPRSSADVLYAQVETCAQRSSPAGTIEVGYRGYLPPPVVVEPVFGCQTKIGVNGIVPGAIVEVFADGTSLGTVCSCWSSVTINFGRAFVSGERITAIQRMNYAQWDCVEESLESQQVDVVDPDERIKPQILEPLYEDDSIIRVANQIEGGTITIFAVPSAGEEETEIGSRPSSEYPEIPVPESVPLKEGQIIRAMQELCGRREYSNPVTVQALPERIDPPKVRAPLYACSVSVAVDNIVPGATVYVLQDEIPIGHAWSSDDSVIVCPVTVLRENSQVTAYQVAGTQRSSESDLVVVDAWEERLPRPSLPPPIRPGDTSVWVTNLVPGAYIRIFDNGVQIGGGHTVDYTSAIPVWWPIGDDNNDDPIITASQSLCMQESVESAPRPATPGASCDGPPQYEPRLWNNNSYVRDKNNCYNYGCNIRTDTYAQPGYAATGLLLADISCTHVTNGALADGLNLCSGACHPCHHKVALVIAPGLDYHWYRQDNNGRWSHKPGSSSARDTDESGNLITDPETADRSFYTEFCGYFCVNKNEVVIS